MTMDKQNNKEIIMNEIQQVIRWWNAWRYFTDVDTAADLFQVKRRTVRAWLRAGLQHHEYLPGLATCERSGDFHGRPVWKMNPYGVVVWHIQRLPYGGVTVPRLVSGLPDIWAETWRTVAAVAPQTYPAGAVPPFSWKRLTGDVVLLSCALALRWKASGFDWGGPFIIGADMPGEFAINFISKMGA